MTKSSTSDVIVDRVVITLDGSPRIAEFEKQFELGQFRRHSAFDGRGGRGEDVFDCNLFVHRVGRLPLGGEIGCAISHFRVLEQFAAKDGRDEDLILVAEDDVRFGSIAEPIINSLLRCGMHPDLVVLYDVFGEVGSTSFRGRASETVHLSWLSRIVYREGCRFYRVGTYSGILWGSALYLVSRRAAREYVQWVRGQGERLAWLSDEFHVWARLSGIRPAVLRPGIASTEGESSISADRSRLGVAPGLRRPSGGRPTNLRFLLRKIRRSWEATCADLRDWRRGLS